MYNIIHHTKMSLKLKCSNLLHFVVSHKKTCHFLTDCQFVIRPPILIIFGV